jgi:hypothetical protein
VDRYRLDLPRSRSLLISAEQIRRIAVGLGCPEDAAPLGGNDPLIVATLRVLPATARADAFAVALLRFGHKQDVETICRLAGLRSWRVCELEAAFVRAAGEARAARAPAAVVGRP